MVSLVLLCGIQHFSLSFNSNVSDTSLARKTITAPTGQRSDLVGPHPTPTSTHHVHGNSCGDFCRCSHSDITHMVNNPFPIIFGAEIVQFWRQLFLKTNAFHWMSLATSACQFLFSQATFSVLANEITNAPWILTMLQCLADYFGDVPLRILFTKHFLSL